MSEEAKNKTTYLNVDLSYLRDVASGSNEFMVDMIELFLDQTPLYFEQLDQYIKEENWQRVADIAHKIKPSLAFMGAEKAKDDMAQIETNARNLKDLDLIQVTFKLLNEQSSGLFSKLEEIKVELKKGG